MGRSGSVSGANEARGEVRSCRLGRHCLGAAVVLAIACGGLQLPAFAAPESIDAGVMMPTPILPRVDPTPASIVRPESPLTRMPAGNPLWAIPLRMLNETRDRPLFSPSRRPPPAAVVAAPVVAPRPPAPVTPDHPALTLVGTVVGGRNSIGIFVDQASKNVIRLRIGQDRDGWTLRAIHKRDAVFDDRRRKAILALPATGLKGNAANFAANPTQALPTGTWVDGDGQLTTPPKHANGAASPPYVQPAAATWVDGDGQLISPPQVRY